MKQIVACLLLFLVCACSSQENLKGKFFEMQKDGTKITLGFDASEPNFYGAVVNRYFGSYKTDGAKIDFSPAGATMMMGPESAMKAEQEWLQMLPDFVEYRLEGSSLILMNAEGGEIVLNETTPEK